MHLRREPLVLHIVRRSPATGTAGSRRQMRSKTTEQLMAEVGPAAGPHLEERGGSRRSRQTCLAKTQTFRRFGDLAVELSQDIEEPRVSFLARRWQQDQMREY